MRAISGDASVPVTFCRGTDGTWHRMERSVGGANGGAFNGSISYRGDFSGSMRKAAPKLLSGNGRQMRFNFNQIVNASLNARPVDGDAEANVVAKGTSITARLRLQGSAYSASFTLSGLAREGTCELSEAGTNAKFSGACGAGGLVGTLTADRPYGWRTSIKIRTRAISKVDSDQETLKTAQERERAQEAAKETREAIEKRMRLLMTTADGGNVESMRSLALMYDSGDGYVTADAAKAAYWYQKAVDHGDTLSMFNLGIMYSKGEGVANDPATGLKLFRRCVQVVSEEQAACARLLGIMYALGKGVPENKAEALRWLKFGAARGDEGAKKVLAELTESG